MTESRKCNPPLESAPLESIFARDSLELVGDDSVERCCEHESGFTGPWRVEARDDDFAVLRDGIPDHAVS